ncbi:hypothetical protein C8F04DRAFT_1193468 [Mycena alexandri]|uniref:Uncharacterized protein n=1 Tax=Mycena alexandri TaxID=1745969 RepID=A0AAD6SBY4_9AGAR|nr:hypothetical protein C8F04DRAFT_1193468 [Mycena alexandri]
MPIEVAIVLAPTLAWVQDHWRELALATNLSVFNIAFERFVAQNASLTVNGESTTRHWYKQLLYSSFGIGTDDTCKVTEDVDFINVLEIPQNDPNFVKDGEVALLYNATCAEGISSVHLSVERIAAECPKPPVKIRGYCDPRRVVHVNHAVRVPESSNFSVQTLGLRDARLGLKECRTVLDKVLLPASPGPSREQLQFEMSLLICALAVTSPTQFNIAYNEDIRFIAVVETQRIKTTDAT